MTRHFPRTARGLEKTLFCALGVVIGIGSLALVAGAFERPDADGHPSLREQVLAARAPAAHGDHRPALALQMLVRVGDADA
jgi:hypothetical protein